MLHRPTIRRRTLLAAGVLGPLHGIALAAPGGLPTNVGHGDSSPEFDRLRETMWGRRPIAATGSVVQLAAPTRAAFGASVPVKVSARMPQTPTLYVRRLVLVVDKNPAPVAAVLDLTPDLGQADIEARVRVDEYSHVRVVAELSYGELHMDSRYVKTSGGCSAPPNRDRPDQIGRTELRLPEGVKPSGPTPVEVRVIHPNDTGFELNHVTVMFIPPHFVRSLRLTFNGRPLLDAALTFAISENPFLRFHFVPRGPGVLKADVEDTKDQRFSGTLALD